MSPLATALIAFTAATTSTTIYSDYPGFVDTRATVEAYVDRGPILELIVKCPVGTGMLTYSKIEHRYCSSKLACFASLKSAIRETCD